MIRLLLCLTFLLAASSCAAYEAVVSFFVSSDAAAQAAEDAAHQAEETLHTLQHALLLIPAYIAGEVRKPLWGKVKSLNGKRRNKRASA